MLSPSCKLTIALLAFITHASFVEAATARYRCMWRDDPATTMVIGWDQVSGHSPELFYDVVDFGQQVSAYRNSLLPQRVVVAKGMHNHFVRLTGLHPNTVYYFIIKDSEGTSQRMSFQTTPHTPDERLSIISGGDSRNNREARRDANRLVGKLRPHFVMFNGDMTAGDTNQEWRDWFDDWQETMGSDNRLFPVLAARGNHEASNATITELFDVSSADVHYALTFGGNLLRVYTLNSMIAPGGSQRDWLEGDLRASKDLLWKLAQYHHPIRPHTARKPEKDELLINWATLFYKYRVDLVSESDAHVVKATYPIRPSQEPGSEEGFIRDDREGTVYVGEGCWGAPLREANDEKSWTLASGSFNSFQWVMVSREKIEVRTIRTDGSRQVAEVNHGNIFEPPIGLVIWNPPAGDVVYIYPHATRAPLTYPALADPLQQEAPKTAPEPPPPSRPEKTKDDKPTDPNDWSAFPKVSPNSKGDVIVHFTLSQVTDVTVQLISREWKPLAKLDFLREPAGAGSKSIDLSRVPAGEYLLVIKGAEKILQRYHLVVP
jgi:acid phosphatase type 7